MCECVRAFFYNIRMAARPRTHSLTFRILRQRVCVRCADLKMHICTIQLLTAFRVFLASNSICSQIGQPNNAQRYACAPYMRMPQQSLCVPRRIISLPSSSRLASSSSWHTHTHTRSVAHCATKHVPDQRAFTCPDRDRVCELCLARALGEWRRAAAAHTHGVSSLPLRSSPLSLRATLAV